MFISYKYNTNRDYLYFLEHFSEFNEGVCAIQNGKIIGEAHTTKDLISLLNSKYELGTYFVMPVYKGRDIEYPAIDFYSDKTFFKGFYLE